MEIEASAKSEHHSRAGGPGPIDWQRPLSVFALLGQIVLVTCAAVYAGPWHAAWLIALLVVTLRSPVWGLGLLLVGLPLNFAQRVPFGAVLLFSELQFGMVLLTWILWTRLHRIPLPLGGRILRWSAPFLFAVLLSALLTSSPLRALFNSARIWELFIIGWLATSILKQSRPTTSALSWAVLIVGVGCSLIAMTQFQTARFGRVHSLFSNPNQFAGYLNLLIPFSIVFAMRCRTRTRWLWVCATLFLIFALISTLSRAGVAAFACAMAVMVFRGLLYGDAARDRLRQVGRSIRDNRRYVVLNLGLGLVLLVTLLIVPVARDRVSASAVGLFNRTNRGIAENFIQERLPFYRTGWSIWRDNFLVGVGPGNYWQALRERSDELRLYWDQPSFRGFSDNVTTHVHCLYLQLGLNFGLLGLVSFLYFLGQASRSLWRESSGDTLALAGLGLMVAFVAQNLLDVTFPSLGLHTGLLLGWSLTRQACSDRPGCSS